MANELKERCKMDKKIENNIQKLIDDFSETIKERAIQLYNTGAIDPEKYNKRGFLLPKILLFSAIRDCAHQVRPLSLDAALEIENLKYF